MAAYLKTMTRCRAGRRSRRPTAGMITLQTRPPLDIAPSGGLLVCR
jgi:hypothetical protein